MNWKKPARVFDLFLQILWRGRVTVATSEVLSFHPMFIGFTSNLGSGDATPST